MAESRENLSVICRLGLALNRCNFPSFCLKPLQVKCFEYLLNGYDVIAVLPTGFGKSLLFQLLPDFLPVKADKNVVIVVCPLNSIIEDQLKVLGERGVTADVLQLASDDREGIESLFNPEDNDESLFKTENIIHSFGSINMLLSMWFKCLVIAQLSNCLHLVRKYVQIFVHGHS